MGLVSNKYKRFNNKLWHELMKKKKMCKISQTCDKRKRWRQKGREEDEDEGKVKEEKVIIIMMIIIIIKP